MFGGLLVLPIVGVVAAGGWTNLTTELQSTDENLLRPMGQYGFSVAGIISAVGFLAIGLGFLGSPQLLTRFMSARNQDEIVDASLISVICIMVFDSGAACAGMAGRVLFPDLADPELILPTMSAELFPGILAGLFLVIVLAAIMSTVDSLLLLASSAVVRDVRAKGLPLSTLGTASYPLRETRHPGDRGRCAGTGSGGGASHLPGLLFSPGRGWRPHLVPWSCAPSSGSAPLAPA